ncbi:hypothetical protein I4U23_001358 [Adineta vaga]|nr:hypothetical protein I4U23_001358 [Adineta vaga]
MSMHELNTELEKLLMQMNKHNQSKVIKRLDEIKDDYGAKNIEKWQNRSNNKNALLHELVERDMADVISHVIEKYRFDVNVRRASDGSTPYDLASQDANEELCVLLKKFGAGGAEVERGSRWPTDEEKLKSMNIIWLDLEMTSIEEPEIMECAVIITDSDLNTLDKGSIYIYIYSAALERCKGKVLINEIHIFVFVGNWVIHFDQSVMDKLGDWHQKTFADRKNGGNNLFADCLKSRLTKDQVENELLTLIQRHCPPKMCSLAGSSIHIDKRVLELQMPKVHDYLHYRIIDVSSFQAIMKRWAPWLERKIKDQVVRNGSDTVNHRAMDDIIWSISYMREMRPLLNKLVSGNGNGNNKKHGARDHNHRSPYHRSNSEPDVPNNIVLPKINQNSATDRELYADERRLVDRIKFERSFDVKKLNLTSIGQEIYDNNPHLREVFICGEELRFHKEEFTKMNRILLSTATQLPGDSNSDSQKITTNEHWGQRKLLLPEIEFLTKYSTDPDHQVIYAGAAPGIHINYLASLFPNFEFILIDDKEFSIKPHRNIVIRREKLSGSIARTYGNSKKKVLFICNVRTYQPHQYGMNTVPARDMEDQMCWYDAMKPDASLLYFRLPRELGKTTYLQGRQIIEPWASRRSMECRLVVKKDAKKVDYDHQEFANSLLYFQNVTRIMHYEHDMDTVPNEGLDHCYDCRAEIFIIQKYLKEVQKVKNNEKLKKETAAMSAEISKQIIDTSRKSIIDVPRRLDVIPKRSSVVSSDV